MADEPLGKLVVAIALRAQFDPETSNRVLGEQGAEA
jgi:hypothetical protein